MLQILRTINDNLIWVKSAPVWDILHRWLKCTQSWAYPLEDFLPVHIRNWITPLLSGSVTYAEVSLEESCTLVISVLVFLRNPFFTREGINHSW